MLLTQQSQIQRYCWQLFFFWFSYVQPSFCTIYFLFQVEASASPYCLRLFSSRFRCIVSIPKNKAVSCWDEQTDLAYFTNASIVIFFIDLAKLRPYILPFILWLKDSSLIAIMSSSGRFDIRTKNLSSIKFSSLSCFMIEYLDFFILLFVFLN